MQATRSNKDRVQAHPMPPRQQPHRGPPPAHNQPAHNQHPSAIRRAAAGVAARPIPSASAIAVGPDKAALAARVQQQSHPVARHIVALYTNNVFTVNGGATSHRLQLRSFCVKSVLSGCWLAAVSALIHSVCLGSVCVPRGFCCMAYTSFNHE